MRDTGLSLIAVLAVCALLSGCGGGGELADTATVDTQATYAVAAYQPLAVGSVWRRSLALSGGSAGAGGETKACIVQTTRIVRTGVVDNVTWYVAKIDGMVGTTTMLYRNTQTAAFSRTNCATDNAHFLLKAPLVVGTTWNVAGGTATITAVNRTITVPAGTYTNCILVTETLPTSFATWTYKHWYAPKVGEIKSEVWMGSSLSQREVLKSYTPGG